MCSFSRGGCVLIPFLKLNVQFLLEEEEELFKCYVQYFVWGEGIATKMCQIVNEVRGTYILRTQISFICLNSASASSFEKFQPTR